MYEGISISNSEWLAGAIHWKLPDISRNQVMGAAFNLPWDKYERIKKSLDKPNLREVIKKELNI